MRKIRKNHGIRTISGIFQGISGVKIQTNPCYMNETLFNSLFVQLVDLSLRQSIPNDSEIPQPDHELAFYRIERIGYAVGQKLADRLVQGHRLFSDQLDILKYICKEYWMALFQKQIDNLKTNHKVKLESISGLFNAVYLNRF